jgi:tetratricopeptide (TPR) repeat protein
MAWRDIDEAAIKAYERARDPSLPLIDLHLGELLAATGRANESLPILQSALEKLSSPGAVAGGDLHDVAAACHAMARANAELGHADTALRLYRRALEVYSEIRKGMPNDAFAQRARATVLIDEARQLPGARQESVARAGRDELIRLAERPEAPTDLLELAAGMLLTLEPVELRDGERARRLAERAVEKSRGQTASAQVTLAAATERESDAREAARIAWSEGEVVRPLIPKEGVRRFEANHERLRRIALAEKYTRK